MLTIKMKNALINILLSFIIMVLSGWIADAINGAMVFPWLLKIWLLCDPKHPPLWWSIGWPILFSVLWFAFFIGLYARRATFLPVEILREADPNDIRPHKVVALSVSRVSWELLTEQENGLQGLQLKNKNNNKLVSLPAELDDALTILAGFKEKEKYSWEQILRALQAHQKELLKVYLIGSDGHAGTTKSFNECSALVRYYFPNLQAKEVISKTADFNSLGDLLEQYQSIIRDEYHHLHHLMIDVTGGTKVVSVAAAIVTLEHPNVEFQYVETEGEKRIRTFNVGGGKESNAF